MMAKKLSFPVALIGLWLASLACGQTAAVPTLDPNAASTAIVETIDALNALASPTPSPLPSATPDILTETPIVSSTPEGAALPTLPAVYVTVSVDTFCRLGPAREYEQVGILLVGEIAEVVGRDAFNQHWYIRNPDIGPQYCWITAQYATVEGNVLSLVAQPPAADLSSNVEVTYLGIGKCSNKWWSDLRIRNQSNATFRSISLVIGDGGTNTTRSMLLNVFPFSDGCAPPTSVETMAPGTSVRVSSPEFNYDLAGAEISVSVTICTETDMRGTCVSKTLSYTP